MLDELSSIVDDANACLDGVIDRHQLPDVDSVSERVRVLKKRLDELDDRVRLLSGGRVAYRTDDLPAWLIDKIDDD
ncbi:hypothetical protein [Pleomorphomonas carboxyditropha]|nr:hypothetical protein [Pleomorphomonas carboxyditropha]